MTTKEIYQLAVSMAIKADLRGETQVLKSLQRKNDKYQKLSAIEKDLFDIEKLSNPYSDARILVDNNKSEIKKVLAGIDLEGPELLLAKQMDIDLAISHHPEGEALADLHDVMEIQAEALSLYGVPINIAESVIKSRISEVSRSVLSANHDRHVDMARVLGIDYMTNHTTTDNLGARYLYDLIESKQDSLEYVEDVLALFDDIEEYKVAKKKKAGPRLFTGSSDNKCGKIAITEFTGGTSGSKDMYEKMAQYGIGTIIGMHMHEEHRKEAEKNHINVIIAGHMSSDSLGMNLFLDQIEQRGVEVIPIAGLIRVKRF